MNHIVIAVLMNNGDPFVHYNILACVLSFLFLASPSFAVTVRITQPANGDTVSGLVTILGTAKDLGSGRVAISIDGGAFINATGTNNWSFVWDTAAIPDGVHTITARARQCISCPPVFFDVNVLVQNQPAGLSVSILNPTEGQVITTTLVMSGVSSQATSVAIAVDGGPFQNASGVTNWDFVFEPGSIPVGPHTLTARATNATNQVSSSVNIVVSNPTSGQQSFTYASSIDGERLDGVMYIPNGYNAQHPPVGLICYLHGGGGLGTIPQDWIADLDARGWILIAPDGRRWGLADPNLCPTNPNAQGACTWCTSAGYVNNPFDARVGPGEQDILDAIDWASATFNINPDRVYLSGFSMGGRGTYLIGLRNPDRFAAIAPLSPASDMYEIFNRRPDPSACKEGMVSDGAGGGRPGDSLITDTLYTITSGRFLIENAYNLPVIHCHGTQDAVAFNIPGTPNQYLHGAHMLNDNSWSGCHDAAGQLCFGHTPTLSDLRTRHPAGYDWDFRFTPVSHVRDQAWTNPIFSFFDAHTLVRSPETIVYKSYTDQHRRAYWCQIDHASPWTDTPAAIRVTRSMLNNRIDAEVARVATATFDLSLAGLALTRSRPLIVSLRPLVEPVYDPAISAAGASSSPMVVLLGDFSTIRDMSVRRNGVADPAIPVQRTSTQIRIGPVPAHALTTLECLVNKEVPTNAPIDEALVTHCRADYDGNSMLDTLDLNAFIHDFSAGTPGPGGYAVSCESPNPFGFKADWDGDCVLTEADLFGFMDAFADGCW